MWITYKTKKDEMLDAVAKAQKVSKVDTLFAHPKNKALVALHKKKKPIPKGTVIYVPDPKAKCYVTKIGSKKVAMSEAEWKATQAKLDKAMAKAAGAMRSSLTILQEWHREQASINREFFWVHTFSRTWFGDKGTEPAAEAKAAESAVKKLEAVAKGKKYKDFEASLKTAAAAIDAYGKKMREWVAKLTGDAGTITTGLTWTRDISFVVFGAAAMTVAAPVGVGATLVVGAGVGAGSASMEGMATEVGTAIASNADKGDPYSIGDGAARVAKKVGIGALAGLAGAGASKFIGKYLAPKIAARLMSGNTLNAFSKNFVNVSKFGKPLVKRLVDAEVKAINRLVGQEAAKAAGTIAFDKVATDVTSRFLVRLGPSSLIKLALRSPDILKWFENWLSKNAANLDATSPEKIAQAALEAFMNDQIMTDILETLIKENAKELEGELCVAIREEYKKAGVPVK